MTTEGVLLEKLERCIETVGEEFHTKSDYWFWQEEHFRARILHYLWQDPKLWVRRISGGPDTPLAQPEFSTRSGGRESLRLYDDMRIGDADRYGFTLIARRCDYSVWKTKTGTRYDVCDRKLNYCTVRNGTFGTEAEALACFGQLPDVPSPWLESDKGETQHYDIALLTEEIAQEVVEDFAYESWQSLIKMIPVLAAVEIEHCPYNQDPSGHIEELIEKLKKNHDNGQVTQGYIFVACYARKINNNPAKREFYKMDELKPLNAVKDACQLLRKEGIDYIKIYWTSDHPNDKPGWLCRQSIT